MASNIQAFYCWKLKSNNETCDFKNIHEKQGVCETLKRFI